MSSDSLEAKCIVVDAEVYYNLKHKIFEIQKVINKCENKSDPFAITKVRKILDED